MAAKPFAQAAGYTVDLVYPSSFVLGQTPLQLNWVAAAAGAIRKPLSEPFRYCDLGCGDGSTLSLLAACYPQGEFVGIDLNEAHIALGRSRAASAGLGNLSFIEADFAGLDALQLPAFDYLAAYGVYSWLAPELQQAIDRFAARQLVPGGLFAVHYSSLPGSAVRDTLNFHWQAFGAAPGGSSDQRIAAGLDALRRLAPASRFFEQNPQALEMLRSVDAIPAGTLAHDILNRRTHSFYSLELIDRMAGRGLQFLGSANVLPDHPELLLPASALAICQDLLADADRRYRETIHDLMLNTAVRFDLFTRADPETPPADSESGWRGIRDHFLQRASTRDLEPRERWSTASAVDLRARIYSAILELASATAISLDDLLGSRELDAFGAQNVWQAIRQLFALGLLKAFVQRPLDTVYCSDRRYRLSSALNAMRLRELLPAPSIDGLASTVLGAPLLMPAAARLQLTALLGGDIEPAWRAGAGAAGLSLERFRAELEASLPRFETEAVPELLRLGVIEEDR